MDKLCPRCKEWKNLSEFNKDSNRKDGHNTHCRECKKEEWREHRLRKKMGCIGMGYSARYRVIYDPCDSFTHKSSFTRREVAEMLEGDDDGSFLAIGTRFRRGKREYRVNEEMHLEVE